MSGKKSNKLVYDDPTYLDYYNEYQKKYAMTVRESDRQLMEIIRQLTAKRLAAGENPSLLDIGCSTGNFLLHLRSAIPQLELWGGDYLPSVIEDAACNPALDGVRFEVMDMLELKQDRQFDLVITNAATHTFVDGEYQRVINNIGSVLADGGYYISFDYFTPFEEELTIIERAKGYPEGSRFHIRSYNFVSSCLKDARFEGVEFRAFNLPIDLEKPQDMSSINTYTVTSVNGERLCFRGSLYQPWCFVVAQKRSA